ncbi:tafazzin [Xylariales sp. AK1849]|nr:tafazzin [Xylariales sp. AK1849]
MANGDVEPSSPPATVPLQRPSLPWRASSSVVMGLTGLIWRGFLYGLNTVETTGLQGFLKILDDRENIDNRQRGLITVCNHVSVMDDPLTWGVLPLRYTSNPTNLRWSLGAHDICFKNKAMSTFFSLGQVLPTHRLLYSQHGGAFQPTIPQAIRLLSSQPFAGPPDPSSPSSSLPDPMTSGGPTYTTTGSDSFKAPSVYAQNRLAWVHIFPEGCIHQHPSLSLRYFKWGFSRLILEADPMPDVLPMFIDGTQHMLSEARTAPRFLPRIHHTFRVAFGELLDAEAAFGDLRQRWQELVRREAESREAKGHGHGRGLVMGELSDELKYGREAQELRIEVAKRMRDEIEKLRVGMGYLADDPSLALAETWAREPAKGEFESNVDGSLVKKE